MENIIIWIIGYNNLTNILQNFITIRPDKECAAPRLLHAFP